MISNTPTVFVNSSKEGIARVKAGSYAYMMESSMLEYYMGKDCQLQTIGGLLDSKVLRNMRIFIAECFQGYGVALPKGSPLREIFSKAILLLQERTILEAFKNKWWKGAQLFLSITFFSVTTDCPTVTDSHSSLHRVFGIFYVLLAGLLIAVFLAAGEFCVESKQRSVRMRLTLLGRFFNWIYSSPRRLAQNVRSRPPRSTRLDTMNDLAHAYASSQVDIPFRQVKANEPRSWFLDDGSIQKPMADSRSREDFRRISRLIPPGDEILINRRISTITQ